MTIDWSSYDASNVWDEMISPGGRARPGTAALKSRFAALSDEEIRQRRVAAELAIRTMGITFTVYGDEGSSIDREWPFDLIPRLIRKDSWDLAT